MTLQSFSHTQLLDFIRDNPIPYDAMFYESGIKIKNRNVMTNWVNYKIGHSMLYRNSEFITKWIKTLQFTEEKQQEVLDIYNNNYRCMNSTPDLWFGYKDNVPSEFYIGQHSFEKDPNNIDPTLHWEFQKYESIPHQWKSLLDTFIGITPMSVFVKTEPLNQTYYLSYPIPATKVGDVLHKINALLMELKDQLLITESQIKSIIEYLTKYKRTHFARIAVSSNDPTKLSIYFVDFVEK